MPNEEDTLANYFTKVSTGEYSEHDAIELHLLDNASANALTEKFDFHPAVKKLDGLVLDDPNTSNHHILLRRHPFVGQVLYLSHDGESRIVFASLAHLLEAANQAKADDVDFREMHPDLSPQPEDQEAVSNMIRQLVDEEEIEVAVMLIPSMNMTDIDLLATLASNDNFYLGEVIAEEIAKRPAESLRQIALLCSQHRHPQVSMAGAKALQALNA
jgi:hypothetical protein